MEGCTISPAAAERMNAQMNKRRFLDLCEEYGITVTTGNGEVTMNGKYIDLEHAVSDAFSTCAEQPPQKG